MKKVKIKLLHQDSRGSLYNVVNTGLWADVNFVCSPPGIERGGHYHEKTTEAFFIIEGRVNVMMLNIRTGEEVEFNADALDYFEIKPYWTHTLKTLEPTKWMAFLSRRLDEKKPDIHKPL